MGSLRRKVGSGLMFHENLPACLSMTLNDRHILLARSWQIPVERELPAKKGRCYKNLAGRNFDFRAKSSREKFFMYISSEEVLALKSKLRPAKFL